MNAKMRESHYKNQNSLAKVMICTGSPEFDAGHRYSTALFHIV